MKASDLVGKRFGSIEVLRREPNDKYGKTRWLCRCDCGTEWVASVATIKRIGRCRKCGYRKVSESNTKHGDCTTRLYHIYRGMLNRCTNPNNYGYHWYGGRGIRVCDEWQGNKGYESFKAWALVNGYNDEQTIERIDVDGNYCPDNCKWIPQNEQAHNRRSSRVYEVDGKRQDLSQWAKDYGVEYHALRSRLRRGMDIREALTKPIAVKH